MKKEEQGKAGRCAEKKIIGERRWGVGEEERRDTLASEDGNPTPTSLRGWDECSRVCRGSFVPPMKGRDGKKH